MSTFLQLGLALVYFQLTAFIFLCSLTLCGIPVAGTIWGIVPVGWTLFCFSAAYFSTDIFLFFQFNTRKPILAEEVRLQRCFGEVLQRAGGDRQFRLLIEEKLNFNAFSVGHNTIVLSRGLTEKMTDAELKGILAHELGHLKSKDCLVGAAFHMASHLTGIIQWAFTKARRIMPGILFLRGSRISVAAGIILLVFPVYLLYRKHLLLPTIGVFLFVKLSGRLERLFLFLWNHLSRFTEYKQDAYAHRLGYGAELRQALYRLTLEVPQPVNRYFILMKSSHPVIYNRIRRLEMLEGLRGER